jgi:hypothetical protein
MCWVFTAKWIGFGTSEPLVARITLRGRSHGVHARELTPEEAVALFRDVFAPLVRRYGDIAAWIVKHVDHIDVGDPVGAARGRPVFELTPV